MSNASIANEASNAEIEISVNHEESSHSAEAEQIRLQVESQERPHEKVQRLLGSYDLKRLVL